MIKRYTQGSSKAAIDTFVISGGTSGDSLGDEFIDYINPTVYKINGDSYTYNGDTDIPVGMVGQGVVVLTVTGVVISPFVLPDSIQIASFVTDGDGFITSYTPVDTFAINKELAKVMENQKQIIRLRTPITINDISPDFELVSLDVIDVVLPSKAGGGAYLNTIQPFTETIAPDEMLIAVINREVNTDIPLIKKTILQDTNVDDFIVAANYDGKCIMPNFQEATATITEPSVIAVGGIPSGTTFNNVSLKDFIDLLCYPELFGTLSNPSSTFTSDETGFREVGQNIGSISFTSSFNRGSISPQYQSAEPFRSGMPNSHVLTGTGLNTIVTTDMSRTISIGAYTVLLGNQSWSGRVTYDAGVQPKGSKGTDFNSPLSAGQTGATTRTITGVYPAFATTSSLTVSKQPLAAHGSVLVLEMVAEDGVNKQAFEVPLEWGTVSKLEQFNTLSGQYDVIPTGSFTLSATTNVIQSNTINYRRYTHNGETIAARRVRVTF